MARLRFFTLLVVAACASPLPSPPRPATQGHAAAKGAQGTRTGDERVISRSGAAFTVPRGWKVTKTPTLVTAEAPDRIVRVTMYEHEGTEALTAIAAGWTEVLRAPAPTPADEPDTRPPADGWDAITSVDYEGPPGRRPLSAIARRFGPRTYVALIEADPGSLDRRAADLDALLGSLTPAGMKDESFVGRLPNALEGARAVALDRFVGDALTKLAVPGAAVAVVERGRVVYERAFGVRELGGPAKVSRDTLFLVGSVTKPMTSLMEAALVDAGVLTWETPVTDLLPTFAVGDAGVTKQLALWHMACACTGMPRHDLENLFEYERVTPEAHLATLRALKPTTALGEVFQYSNGMYAAGGFAAARAFSPGGTLAEAYTAAMRAKVFGPIGMRATTMDFAAVAGADHASPHALTVDGRTAAMPLAIERNVLPIAPAGAVFSTLADMERFAQTELAGGVTPAGRRVVSERNVLARRSVRVRSGDGSGYGLGLDVWSIGGISAIGHDGGAFGYGTTLLVLPTVGLALVVLTNVRNGGDYAQLPFNDVVARRVVELIFDARELAQTRLEAFVTSRRKAAARATRGLSIPPDSAWMAGLVGTYRHPSLGTLVVSEGGLDAGEWKTKLGRRAGQEKLVFLDPPFAGTEISVDRGGAQPRIVVAYGPDSYGFERVAE